LRQQQQITTDEQLWEKLRAGDESAFTDLMRRYHPALVVYCKKLCADPSLINDCIQEVFIDLWTYRHNLSPVHSLRAYLFVAIRNRIARAHRQNRWSSGTDELNDNLEFNATFSYEDQLIEAETERHRIQQLNQFLNALPARQREALYLKFYQNLSNAEIASIMGVSYQTATNFIYRALQDLRAQLSPESSRLFLAFLSQFVIY
jgi:RNA polymerase sigma factor (sigma-70 family)